jgi:hypothetical protein
MHHGEKRRLASRAQQGNHVVVRSSRDAGGRAHGLRWLRLGFRRYTIAVMAVEWWCSTGQALEFRIYFEHHFSYFLDHI